MKRRWNAKGFSASPDEAIPVWPRAGLVVFGLVLIAQTTWILLAEFQHPRRIRIPVDPQASAVALLEQAPAKRAAKLAVIRGDLWAESAFTYSSPFWTEQATGADGGNGTAEEARSQLERALRYSPHRGDVWLLLAAMADRYHWQGYRPSALLKMSYYTAPNEQMLFPLRIKVSLHAAGLQDPELPDMIRRDIRLVITRTPALKPALVAIYKAAPGPDRLFVERVVSEIDPAYLASMRAGSQ